MSTAPTHRNQHGDVADDDAVRRALSSAPGRNGPAASRPR